MISRRLKILFAIGLSAIAFFATTRLYYYVTDDFTMSNITHDMSQEREWSIPRVPLDQETRIKAILSQPFTYIGKGAQCYAFESEDHQYVLKFFKFKHLRPVWYIRMLPSIPPFKNIKVEVEQRKRRKLNMLFDGYAEAWKDYRQESDLIYVHLQPTDYLNQSVILYDKIGIKRVIPLDETFFALQRKGVTFKHQINKQLAIGDLPAAKHSIDQILQMYIRGYQRGFSDQDRGVMDNTGFVDGHAFHLDVGRLKRDDNIRHIEVYQKDLKQAVSKIDDFIKKKHPEHYPQLSAFLSDQYKLYTGSDFSAAQSEKI
jgi:hypothetical protein